MMITTGGTGTLHTDSTSFGLMESLEQDIEKSFQAVVFGKYATNTQNPQDNMWVLSKED